jgi:hypothetical protein
MKASNPGYLVVIENGVTYYVDARGWKTPHLFRMQSHLEKWPDRAVKVVMKKAPPRPIVQEKKESK